MDLALDVHPKLGLRCGVSVRTLGRFREVYIWKRAALLCLEICDVVVVPIIARCERLEEVVCCVLAWPFKYDSTDILMTKSGVGPAVPFAKPSGTVSGFRKAGDSKPMSISGKFRVIASSSLLTGV
jgi:hypothetical protein